MLVTGKSRRFSAPPNSPSAVTFWSTLGFRITPVRDSPRRASRTSGNAPLLCRSEAGICARNIDIATAARPPGRRTLDTRWVAAFGIVVHHRVGAALPATQLHRHGLRFTGLQVGDHQIHRHRPQNQRHAHNPDQNPPPLSAPRVRSNRNITRAFQDLLQIPHAKGSLAKTPVEPLQRVNRHNSAGLLRF